MNRHLFTRITIDIEQIEADRRRERERKLAYYKRMKAAGIRGTSIQKYLRRGFPGPFVKAVISEMQQLATDIKRKWWLAV